MKKFCFYFVIYVILLKIIYEASNKGKKCFLIIRTRIKQGRKEWKDDRTSAWCKEKFKICARVHGAQEGMNERNERNDGMK